ncbi:MAG: ribonuclease P protein component [Sulfurospirillaceae bacterium]|nr:ribonuclease P protein component [Sulfurospirillaceae bacterium]
MGRLSAYDSLKENREFVAVYNEGKKWHCEGAVIFYKASSDKKVGFVASKRVGNAVKRNYCKRRLRALFLELQKEVKSGIYIFIATSKLLEMDHFQAKRSVRWALKKLGCF